MKTLTKLGLLAVTMLLLASCGPSIRITTDYDRSVDFTKFRTFGIFNLPENAQTISQLNAQRVYAAIRADLISKGFTESTTPDIWVNSVMVVDTREQHSSTTTGMNMGMGMGMGGMGWGMGGMHRPYMWGGPMMMTTHAHTQYRVEEYNVGSLMIDIINAKNNTLIWHSNGSKRINNRMRNNPDEKINQYVSQIMDTFPPGGLAHMVRTVK